MIECFEPLSRVFFESLGDDVVEVSRSVFGKAREQWCLVGDDLGDDRCRIADEGSATGDQREQRGTDRVQVGPLVDFRSPHLFGGAVEGCAQEAARLCQVAVDDQRLGQPVVTDLQPTVGVQETVRRFHVAMDHPGRMSGREPVDDVEDQVDGAVDRHRSLVVGQVLQGPARHQFHHDERAPLFLAGLEDERAAGVR